MPLISWRGDVHTVTPEERVKDKVMLDVTHRQVTGIVFNRFTLELGRSSPV
jgi:hypothetical protein